MSSGGAKAVKREGVSRRGVLKAGLLGTAATIAGSVGLGLRATRLIAPPGDGLQVLSAKEYAVLAAIAERICPASGDGAPGATQLDVARLVDRRLATLERDAQDGVKVVLMIFENALTGALFGERLAPFTQLDPDAQDRILLQWRASTVAFRRTAFGAFNALVGSTYYGEAATWARIGYGGPPSVGALRVGFSMNLVDYDSLRARKG